MVDDAINAYKKSIEIEPDNARSHYSLGTLYAMKGKFSDAADEFWMAVEINPGMSEAHYNLGLSYFRQGMFDKAINEYQTTLKLLPETQTKKRAGVHYKLGMAYEGNKVFSDAMHELEKAIELMPKDARIHHQLSVVYKKAGLFEKAKEEAKIYEKLKKGKTHH
ncbi:MAG: tetratricopeptide repeat protein [Candidatus Brocadiales bacterium]|nr:tetratricopeptide repeat protein [Candidatus Brocadiales bacterium]